MTEQLTRLLENQVMTEKMIEDISARNLSFQEELASSFTGIECRIDPELKGNEHYLMISEELFGVFQRLKESDVQK